MTAAIQDGGSIDLTLSDDMFDCERLDIERVPNLVTICKIGEHCVVDPSAEEEVCSSASVVVGVSNSAKGDALPVRTQKFVFKSFCFNRLAHNDHPDKRVGIVSSRYIKSQRGDWFVCRTVSRPAADESSASVGGAKSR